MGLGRHHRAHRAHPRLGFRPAPSSSPSTFPGPAVVAALDTGLIATRSRSTSIDDGQPAPAHLHAEAPAEAVPRRTVAARAVDGYFSHARPPSRGLGCTSFGGARHPRCAASGNYIIDSGWRAAPAFQPSSDVLQAHARPRVDLV